MSKVCTDPGLEGERQRDLGSDGSPIAGLQVALLAQDCLVGVHNGKWFKTDILKLV